MANWLGVVRPEVWEEANLQLSRQPSPHRYGFSEGRRMSVKQIKVGDRISEYMTKVSRFLAVFEVVGEYVFVPDRVYAGEVFPECVEVKPIVGPRSPEKGIKNNWNVSVRKSACRLDDGVAETILNALREAAK